MRILVIGGTGTVGSRLVARLREGGHEAMAAVRNPGPDGLMVDVAQPGDLRREAEGFEAAFLMTPLGPDEGEIGVAAVEALREAGVGKLVYLAIHNLEEMREIPHFATKIPVKQAVLGRSDGVVLGANFFFQNDLMALPAITGPGIYPLPIGTTGVYNVDAGDIAAAAARAITRSDWDGKAVPVCGTECLTGPDLARNWGEALGREVHYAGDDVEPFVAQMRERVPGMSDWMAEDFAIMMRVTQERGCPASESDIDASAAIIGHPPVRHAEFVQETLRDDANGLKTS